jgi:hypothetical protein
MNLDCMTDALKAPELRIRSIDEVIAEVNSWPLPNLVQRRHCYLIQTSLGSMMEPVGGANSKLRQLPDTFEPPNLHNHCCQIDQDWVIQ